MLQVTASYQNGSGAGQHRELVMRKEFFTTYIKRMSRIGARTLRGRGVRSLARPFSCLTTWSAVTIPLKVIGIRGELARAEGEARPPGATERVRCIPVTRGNWEDGLAMQRGRAHIFGIW